MPAAHWMATQARLAEKALQHRQAQCLARSLDGPLDGPLDEQLLVLLRREEQFLATLLDELRSPLAPIANALDLLASRGDDPRTVIGARSVIRLQLRQLTRLVNDLRDASGIARGAIELHRERR